MSAPRGGFPVDGVETVAGNVLAQLLEIAALPDLAHGLRATVACPQKEGGDLFALGFQVGIDPHLDGLGIAAANIPKRKGDAIWAQSPTS